VSAQPAVAGSAAPDTAPDAARDAQRAAALWLRLGTLPHGNDLFQLLRRIESTHPHLPRLGEALRPTDEPLRIAQEAALTFAPSAVTALQMSADHPPRLVQRVFGLLGPNGPLPTHLTEYVRERQMHHADPTLLRFIDTLTHRFALLFYRAWAQAQPVVGLDRERDTRYARWIGSLFGLGNPGAFERDALGDHPKLHFAGRLARSVRDADGLRAWIESHFGVPVRVEQWCGHWMRLGRDERSRLTRRGALGLGRGAVLGEQVWDVQHKFRIVIGALDWARYASFAPGGAALDELQAMVRQYLGFEFEWDLRVILKRADVPALRLQGPARRQPAGAGALGRSAWLNPYLSPTDADGYIVNVERSVETRARRGQNPASRSKETA